MNLLSTSGCFGRYHGSLPAAPYNGDTLRITTLENCFPGFCARGQTAAKRWERTSCSKHLPAQLPCTHLCRTGPAHVSGSSCPGKPPSNQGSVELITSLCLPAGQGTARISGQWELQGSSASGGEICRLKATSKPRLT